MKVFDLVYKEIKRRKLNFFLGLLSVLVAVSTVTGALTMLRIHDINTSKLISEKEKETRERAAILEDDYRKIMKNLGFNLLILPRDQNVSDLYADDFATKYMPESYIDSLASSKSIYIRHLLPSLQQKMIWPEKQRTILLTGIRGEVPFLHKAPKEPMMVAVPEGTLMMGYELHKSLGLKSGDKTELMGKSFTVGKCNEARGNIDDITIWIALDEAQMLLKKPGKINAILALKCHCAGSDLGMVRDEVHAVLPGTRVLEKGSKVVMRAEARNRAAQEAREAIAAEKKHREQIRRESEGFAAVLVPMVILFCALWIVFLFVGNVRERKSEIGILRAMGVNQGIIRQLFFYKALVMGITGAVAGFFLGMAIGGFWGGLFTSALFNVSLLVSLVVLAPLLSVTAAYIPVSMAIRQDPAEVLKEE